MAYGSLLLLLVLDLESLPEVLELPFLLEELLEPLLCLEPLLDLELLDLELLPLPRWA